MATEKTAKQVLDKTAQRRAEREATTTGGKEVMTRRAGKFSTPSQNAVVSGAVTGTDDVAMKDADSLNMTPGEQDYTHMVAAGYDPPQTADAEHDHAPLAIAEYDHAHMAAARYDASQTATADHDHDQLVVAGYDAPQTAAAENDNAQVTATRYDHAQMAAAEYASTNLTASTRDPTQITAMDYKPMHLADFDPAQLEAIPDFTPSHGPAVPEFTQAHMSEYVPHQMVVVPEFTPSHMVAQPDFNHYNPTSMVPHTQMGMGMQTCAGYNYCAWPVYPCYTNMYDGYAPTANAVLDGCPPSDGQICSLPDDAKEPVADADALPPPHGGDQEDGPDQALPAADAVQGASPGDMLSEDVTPEVPASKEADSFLPGYTNVEQAHGAEIDACSLSYNTVDQGHCADGQAFSGYTEDDANKYSNMRSYIGQSKQGLNPDAAEWSHYGVAEHTADAAAAGSTWDANQYYYYVSMPCYSTAPNYADYAPMPHGWTTGEPDGDLSSWNGGSNNGAATWTQMPTNLNMPHTDEGNTVAANEKWQVANGDSSNNAADGEEEDDWRGSPHWWAPPSPPIPETEEWAAAEPKSNDWAEDVDDQWSPVPPSEACASAQDDRDEWVHSRHSAPICTENGAWENAGCADELHSRWKEDTGDEVASSSRSGLSKGNDLGKELNVAGHAVLSLRDVNKMEALNLEMPKKGITWLEDRSEKRERERSKLRRYSFLKEIRSELLTVTPDGSDSEATPTTSAGSDLHQAKSFIEAESYADGPTADDPPTYTRQELLRMRLPKSGNDFCGLRAMSQQQHKKKAERRKRRDRGEERYRERDDRYWDRQTSSYSFSSWQPLVVPTPQKSQPLKRWKSGGHMEELKRSCQSLLNKICPENLSTIVPQLANLAISDAKDIELVIGLIFKKALLEPHYSDTYCDMVFCLRDKFPHFPEADKSQQKDEIVSFTRVLVHTCQREFELLQSEDFAALDDDELMIRKKRCLAHMKLLGSLYLRTLLSHKVIKIVCEDLLRGKPAEHLIECACALVQSLGYAFESEKGPEFVDNLVKRLGELLATGAYGKRIQYMVKDLLDLRANNWQQKNFEAKAGEARKLSEVARSINEKYSLAGARPEYMCSEEAFADHLLQQMKDEKEVSSSFVNTFASLPAIRQQKIVNIMTNKGLADLTSSRRHRHDDSKCRLAEGAIRQLNLDIEVLKAVSIDMRKAAADYYAYPAAASFCDRVEQLTKQA